MADVGTFIEIHRVARGKESFFDSAESSVFLSSTTFDKKIFFHYNFLYVIFSINIFLLFVFVDLRFLFRFLGTQFTVICSFCCGEKLKRKIIAFLWENIRQSVFCHFEQTKFMDIDCNVVRGENETVKKHQREVSIVETLK